MFVYFSSCDQAGVIKSAGSSTTTPQILNVRIIGLFSDDITHDVINLFPGPKGNATVVCSLKATMEPVTFFTIVEYFSDYPERVKKAVNSYDSNRVVSVRIDPSGVIKGVVQASMKKRSYDVMVSKQTYKVSYSH